MDEAPFVNPFYETYIYIDSCSISALHAQCYLQFNRDRSSGMQTMCSRFVYFTNLSSYLSLDWNNTQYLKWWPVLGVLCEGLYVFYLG